LTINNHDIEVVRISRYLGAVIKNTNTENEKKIKAAILAPNKAY
jgi:hypothetical protein